MKLSYPATRTVECVDSLAGVEFNDPYRWLETETEEVRAWQRAQAELAVQYTRAWPPFGRLREVVSRYSTSRQIALPRFAGGRWFWTQAVDGLTRMQAMVGEVPFGDGRALFDPARENSAHPPFLLWISPSPNGEILAVGVCADGSEQNHIRLIDVATGELLRDAPAHTLMDDWAGGVQWLKDSSGFFFTAIQGTASELSQSVFLHQMLPSAATTAMEIPWTRSNDYRMAVVSRDGRYAVAYERNVESLPVAIARLGDGAIRWAPFVSSVPGAVAGHVIGNRFIAVTDVRAPRGRVVAIPLDAADPNDPSCWTELVPESAAVLRTLTPVGEFLYLTEFVDAYARIRILTHQGEIRGAIPLPGRGTVMEMPFAFINLARQYHPDRFVFAFSSLTSSAGIYCHTPGQTDIDTLQSPSVQLEGAIVEDCAATSKDGTQIPYRVVRRSEDANNGPQPTLIHAYGGFNNPHLPQFPGAMAAFVAVGGVFVLAHLRGGGEYGVDWWQAARFDKKQNTYDDLYAVAEDLIAKGRATPALLGVVGQSNGGLTAGVAVTQRPDLWAVGVPRHPRLDLVGACRNSYGRRSTLNDRATNLDDPQQARRIAGMSPYHLVRDGVRYPAIFIDAGDTDPRCLPQDSRKFCARLQRANAADTPILLHVWENVGHGWATDVEVAITENTEWLAFVLQQMGVTQW